MSTILPIHEYFYTWQGEGTHIGKAAFFIRTLGCPIQCPWCDAAGTWHPKYYPKKVQRLSIDFLAAQAKETACEFVVITGGEPAIHDLGPLTRLLKELGLKIHIETSGAFPLKGQFDWITVSPKWKQLPLIENLQKAHELKLIVEHAHSINDWMEFAKPHIGPIPIILNPEWTQHANPVVLNSISNTVKQYGFPFRASYQMHKLYRVDTLDSHSAQPTPLGGDFSLGY